MHNLPKHTIQQTLAYCCHATAHVIFCPKCRHQVLVDGIDKRLKELILEKQGEYSYEVVEMEVMLDHVHLLLDVNPQMGVVKMVG